MVAYPKYIWAYIILTFSLYIIWKQVGQLFFDKVNQIGATAPFM